MIARAVRFQVGQVLVFGESIRILALIVKRLRQMPPGIGLIRLHGHRLAIGRLGLAGLLHLRVGVAQAVVEVRARRVLQEGFQQGYGRVRLVVVQQKKR